MSQYYKSKRERNIYDPADSKPFKLSRSKIDLFLECPRCFYMDRRLGVGRPPGFPFALNSAVDALLKKEFDGYRARGQAHPLIERIPRGSPRGKINYATDSSRPAPLNQERGIGLHREKIPRGLPRGESLRSG